MPPPVPLKYCDRPTIESALNSPRAQFGGQEAYPTLEEKAAVLAYRLAKSQACVDGNKRIAAILLDHFLYRNGTRITVPAKEAREPATMVSYAAESDPKDEPLVVGDLVEWLRRVLVPLS